MTKVVECLFGKHKVLSSYASTGKKRGVRSLGQEQIFSVKIKSSPLDLHICDVGLGFD
jgi:hypothetical protein